MLLLVIHNVLAYRWALVVLMQHILRHATALSVISLVVLLVLLPIQMESMHCVWLCRLVNNISAVIKLLQTFVLHKLF
ncbi:hypothetical protein D3C81_857530 [compost metagenome]